MSATANSASAEAEERSTEPTSNRPNPRPQTNGILTAEEWLELPDDTSEPVFGTVSQKIVRPLTKNIIEAPEKSFKTTVMLRLMLGLSCGQTVFPQLPVPAARRVLYLHGELSDDEIKQRTLEAASGLRRPLTNFHHGRDVHVHLGEERGQGALGNLLKQYRPQDLVLDPWQSFISGMDENSFQHVSKATKFLDYLIDEYGVTLYIVTHMGKDHARGTRGHSSLMGWRDSLVRLARKGKIVTVAIEPRWSAPLAPFKLKFEAGTVQPCEGQLQVSPQSEKIRGLVMKQGGKTTREAVGKFLRIKGDALRQALARAKGERVIELPRRWDVVLAERSERPKMSRGISLYD